MGCSGSGGAPDGTFSSKGLGGAGGNPPPPAITRGGNNVTNCYRAAFEAAGSMQDMFAGISKCVGKAKAACNIRASAKNQKKQKFSLRSNS